MRNLQNDVHNDARNRVQGGVQNDARNNAQCGVQNSVAGVEHIQLNGCAYYDNKKYFLFTPNEPTPGVVPSFRRLAVMQQMSDGTIDCSVAKARKSQSILIKKVAHGRLSATKDGCIQFTFKMAKSEGLSIAEALRTEAVAASEVIK